MSLTSDDVNYIVYRYLQESGAASQQALGLPGRFPHIH
jgi:hypothetical protein